MALGNRPKSNSMSISNHSNDGVKSGILPSEVEEAAQTLLKLLRIAKRIERHQEAQQDQAKGSANPVLRPTIAEGLNGSEHQR